jgi:thioredoxin reductase (NADPH)
MPPGIERRRRECSSGGAAGRVPDPLESTVPGVFAVGDVRSGSVKRVGGAIGEGAAAVALIHRYLASTRPGLQPNARMQQSMRSTA